MIFPLARGNFPEAQGNFPGIFKVTIVLETVVTYTRHFQKKTFGGSYIAPHFWAGSLELLKLIFKFEIIFLLAKPYAIFLRL